MSSVACARGIGASLQISACSFASLLSTSWAAGLSLNKAQVSQWMRRMLGERRVIAFAVVAVTSQQIRAGRRSRNFMSSNATRAN